MHVLLPADLLGPLRLLRTRAPWRALAYLVLETIGGLATITSWLSVVLIPVWLFVWPRAETRILPLSGHRPPRVRRRPWELRWRDVVLVLLTSVMGVAGSLGAMFAGVVLFVLFGMPVAVVQGIEPTLVGSEPVLPALPTAILAPLLGLVLLLLLLWGATALAYGWGLLSTALLRDDERRLAAQVETLSTESARQGDAIALERRALERHLHDGAQMHLGAAAMRLGLLGLDADALPVGPQRTRVLDGLDAVSDQLDRAAQSVRGATQGLVPTALRDGGLCPALREAAGALPLDADVTCEAPRLAEQLEHSLFLIASEALANVTRHAGARRVEVGCRIDGGEMLVLEIRDDGRGGAEATGTGILGMRARARDLGGECALSSPEGGPTEIAVRVPLLHMEHDDALGEDA